jgi:hypothetical protein
MSVGRQIKTFLVKSRFVAYGKFMDSYFIADR